MGNKTQLSTLSLKSTGSKIALGAASVVAIVAISSTAIVGATPSTNANERAATASLNKGNNGNHYGQIKNGNNGNGHGYGGSNNSVGTDITVNQNGDDNVFTLIINYFFG